MMEEKPRDLDGVGEASSHDNNLLSELEIEKSDAMENQRDWADKENWVFERYWLGFAEGIDKSQEIIEGKARELRVKLWNPSRYFDRNLSQKQVFTQWLIDKDWNKGNFQRMKEEYEEEEYTYRVHIETMVEELSYCGDLECAEDYGKPLLELFEEYQEWILNKVLGEVD